MKSLIFILFCAALTCAKVITYVGYSEESQKMAEQEAFAGIAKQISAFVESRTVVSREEVSDLKNSQFQKKIATENTVQSNLVLDGVKIIPQKKQGNLFVAKATLDLDEFTATLRLKMKTIRDEVHRLETLVRENLKEKNYVLAIENLEKTKEIAKPYDSYLKDLSVYMPLHDSLLLKLEYESLQKDIIKRLSALTVAVSQDSALSSGSFIAFSVLVQDKQGALENFPVLILNQGKHLGFERTNASGQIQFRIEKTKLKESPFVIDFIPGIAAFYRNQSFLKNTQFVYEFKMPKKQIRHFNILCQESENVCSAIQSVFKKKLNIEHRPNAEKSIFVQTESTSKRSLKQLTSYAVTLFVSADSFRCSFKEIGVSQTKEEAIEKAISKMNFKSCQALETVENAN